MGGIVIHLEEPGGHFIRPGMMIRDLDGIIDRLWKA